MSDPSRLTLILTGGPQDGTALSWGGASTRTLGSGNDCDLRVARGNVAVLHARVERQGGGQIVLTDAGSSMGTFVNGEKISGPRLLEEGDRVYMGPPGSPESASFIVATPQPDSDFDLAGPPAESPSVIDLGLGGNDAPFELSEPPAVESAPAPEPEAKIELEAPWAAPPTALAKAPPPEEPAVEITPPAAAPARTRPAPKPEYTSEVSIAPEREREPLPLIPPPTAPSRPRPAPRPAAARPKPSGGGPRLLIIGGGAAVLGLAALGAFFFLRAPRPVLQEMTPDKVQPGGTVTLSGTGLGTDPGAVTVRFGDQAGEVSSTDGQRLTVKAPVSLSGGDTQVTVETSGGTSNALFCKITRIPRVASLTPDVALPGAEVVIAGQDLDTKPVSVMIGGIPVDPLEATATSIKFKIPAELPFIEGKASPVVVLAGSERSKPVDLLLGRLPLLAGMKPASGPAGTRVTITGRGFAPTAEGNVVTFGNRRALVVNATASEVTVLCPGADIPGSLLETPVHVEVGGSRSTGAKYQLTRSSSGMFVPYFFPYPADHPGHDHAVVGTDLGPLLVLTGKGAAASTAERASAVAVALNDVVQAVIAGKPAVIEYRDKPEPGVGVAGAAAPFVTAGTEDAAAYQETWGSAKPGGRPGPARLAQYWAALIKDYVALFAAKQRPYHVLELSPRGKTLLEIYGEASRRAGAGNGVPNNLVSPCPARLAEDLRNLALALPGEGESRGSAAVEGAWAGSLEIPGTGRRDIKVRFKAAGAGLAGQLTTKVRTIVLETPLENVSYQKGALTFTAALSGQPHTFRGTFASGTVTGTVHLGSATEAAGSFTLNFVE